MEQDTELKDGGHSFISCPSCKRQLADIWVVNPSLAKQTKIRASCACGDTSFILNVKGGYYAGATPQSSIVEIQTISSVESEGILREEILLKTVKK